MDNLLNKIIIFFKRGKNKVQASVENKNKILAKNSRQKNKKRPVRSYVTLVVFFAFIFLLLDITALILYFIYGKGLVYFLNLFILLILMECIILLYYSLLIRQRRRRLNRRLIRLKKLKHIYRELKEFCYDNNLHFKKMPWYLIIEETESDKSHLFNCDRHQLFKRISQNLSVWTTNDYIAINIKNMITIGGDVKSTYHSRYFELLLEILNKYKENPINGILIMTDSNSLFKLPSALIKSYSKAIVRNINYLYTYCKNIIPIYFIIEKSAELVGFEEFFSKVHIHSSIKETLGYTSDKLIDSSDLNYGGDLINGIEKFINYIEHNRDELLYTAFDSDSCNRRMDYIDSFYQFSFNLKSLLNNLKIAIEICAAESNELNSPFPARGVYFITKSNGIQSSKFINQNSQDTEHNNLENAQNVENYKIEFSLANIFEKVISTESKTVLPMFKNYYIKRRRKRLVFIFLTLCFLFLCYTSYNQYSTFDSQMKKLYGVWSPAKDGRNWYSYRRFKPCISYTYNVRNLGNTKKTKSIVDNATNKNSKESLTKGVEEKDSLFIASIDPRVKLASGESLYSFLNSLILTGDNRINYPSFFYLYQFLPMFNLKEHEMVSLRSIFLTSFIYPLLESSYGTFLFTEDVKWNKTTFVNLIVLVKLLSYLDDTYTNKSLFIENLKVRDYYTFTIGILDFLYKYRNTSVGVAEKKITYEDAAKLSATMAEKSSIINNFLYPEYTAPLDYMMERRIDNDNSISNLVDMEYNLLRRFQSLLSFPLNKINNYNSSLTYNDFYYAREIFRLMQSSNFNNKHALFYDWVKAVKHFSSNMIEANYFNSETPLVLQHWSEHNKDIDEPASDIFVAMKYVSNNRSFEPVIMRGSKNLKFGAMSNINPNSEPSLMFYKTFENLYKNEPEAVVKLPTYWTPLYLLFDGPPERPNDWKYKYWGTWKAAVRISNNLWMSKILIKGYNSVYSLYITFELDDKIAESLKKLEAISSKFNKSQLFTEIGKDPELNNNENLNKNNSNSNKAGKKVKKTEFDKRDITKAENLDLTTNKP